MEQVVACAPVTHRARVQSMVGTSFLGEVFRCFSSPVRQMSGALNSQRPRISFGSQSSFDIRLVRLNVRVNDVFCLSCSCCLGGGPNIELIPHAWRPSMPLCGQESMYVIQS